MAEIQVNNGNIEDALKRFKRQCVRNGVLQEVRKREHYDKTLAGHIASGWQDFKDKTAEKMCDLYYGNK